MPLTHAAHAHLVTWLGSWASIPEVIRLVCPYLSCHIIYRRFFLNCMLLGMRSWPRSAMNTTEQSLLILRFTACGWSNLRNENNNLLSDGRIQHFPCNDVMIFGSIATPCSIHPSSWSRTMCTSWRAMYVMVAFFFSPPSAPMDANLWMSWNWHEYTILCDMKTLGSWNHANKWNIMQG